MAKDGFGSTTVLTAPKPDFRSAANNGHCRTDPTGPSRAAKSRRAYRRLHREIGTAIAGHYRNIVVDKAHRPLVVASRYQYSTEFRASGQPGEALDFMDSLGDFRIWVKQ